MNLAVIDLMNLIGEDKELFTSEIMQSQDIELVDSSSYNQAVHGFSLQIFKQVDDNKVHAIAYPYSETGIVEEDELIDLVLTDNLELISFNSSI